MILTRATKSKVMMAAERAFERVRRGFIVQPITEFRTQEERAVYDAVVQALEEMEALRRNPDNK